jgi:hypothetical protein
LGLKVRSMLPALPTDRLDWAYSPAAASKQTSKETDFFMILSFDKFRISIIVNYI